MAVCRIIDTGVSPEQYEKVRDKVGARDNPPFGSQLHIAAVGGATPPIEYLELHSLITAQQAPA